MSDIRKVETVVYGVNSVSVRVEETPADKWVKGKLTVDIPEHSYSLQVYLLDENAIKIKRILKIPATKTEETNVIIP